MVAELNNARGLSTPWRWPPRSIVVIWVIVLSVAAALVVMGVWLLLRDAARNRPGSTAGQAARDAVTRTIRSAATMRNRRLEGLPLARRRTTDRHPR